MAKVRMYGINNRTIAGHTSKTKEDMRFRKKQSRKGGKAIPKMKRKGC